MHIIHSQDMPTNFYQSYFDIKLQLEKSQSVAHGHTVEWTDRHKV